MTIITCSISTVLQYYILPVFTFFLVDTDLYSKYTEFDNAGFKCFQKESVFLLFSKKGALEN